MPSHHFFFNGGIGCFLHFSEGLELALTLDVEQRLLKAGLVDFYRKDMETWDRKVQDAYNYLKGQYPEDSPIRPDDIAKNLVPVVTVDEGLQAELFKNKRSQQYWFRNFTDLIIDRFFEKNRTHSD